jgi:Tol biopolymer transport system component
MVRATLLAAVVCGVLLGLVGSRAGAADQPQVLLYASDWLGPMRVLAADPSGGNGIRQVTFQRVERTSCGLPWACGTDDPTPSPDGRVLAYRKPGELWFARPDGSHPHRVARTPVEALAWSRDSRRLAYTTYDGLHVVGSTGREDRHVQRFRASELAWSADGRAIAGRDGSRISVLRGGRTTLVATNAGFVAPSLAWLPDGRISFTTGSLWSETNVVTVSATGLGPQRDLGPGWGPAWTPDGRLVAVSTRNGIEVIDPTTRGRRRLSRETGFDLEWSADGRTLAYIEGTLSPFSDTASGGDLRTVTLSGRMRTVVAADSRYGGQIAALAWTRPPAGTRFRAPADDDGVFAGGPVSALAADGERVAYGACRHVFAWTPTAAKTEQIDPVSSAPCYSFLRGWIDSLAVADDRVAWRDRGPGSNTWVWSLQARSLSTGQGSVGSGLFRANNRPWLQPLVGAGDFLAFSTPPDFFASRLTQTVHRVDGVSCPCPEIKAAEGGTPDDPPLTPLDVDDGRLIVRRFDDLVLVLDRSGATSIAISVSPLTGQLDEGQLDGDALVSHVGDELLQHETVKGALVRRWPLPRRARLQDARDGLVAYVLAGQIRTLRLSDGATAAVASGSLARFFDGGLAYAEGARVRVIPFDRLRLR